MSRTHNQSAKDQKDDKSGAQPDDKNGAKQNKSDIMMGEEISMNRIIDFLRDQQKTTYQRETEFIFEKQQMVTRINQLTAQLKAQENINNDLIRRIKMLEFSLRQERIKYAKLAQSHNLDVQSIGNTDIIGQVMQKANLNTNLYERVAKRRAKAQRPLLLKFLQEIGYDDIFNVDEVNEIKALYDKAQEEMRENFEAEMKGDGQNYVDKLEEKMLNANKDGEVEEAPVSNNEVAVIDGSVIVQQKKAEKDQTVKLRYEVKGHFDQVREMFYLDPMHVLASVSEDCQVHLWNLKNISSSNDKVLSGQYDQINLESYFTLRGHRGAIYSITGLQGSQQINQESDKQTAVDRVLFTGGQEGVIKIWCVPIDQAKDDPYPVTKGITYQIGQWGKQENERFDVPIWCLRYNSYTQKLLSIKHDNQIQIWNCTELIERVEALTEQQLQDPPIDLIQQDDPSREFPAFEVNGLEPSAICGSWLPTDHNLFAVCYEGAHLAFFDVSKGTLCQQQELQTKGSEITCMTAHQLEPVVVIGLESGEILLYDYRQQKQLETQLAGEVDERLKDCGPVQSIEFINNGLQLVVGFQLGTIVLYGFKTLEMICIVKNVHLPKGVEALNHLLALNSNQSNKGVRSEQASAQNANNSDAQGMQLPFFISAGADGRIKLFEYNTYAIRNFEQQP